jgi:hypothetical protein
VLTRACRLVQSSVKENLVSRGKPEGGWHTRIESELGTKWPKIIFVMWHCYVAYEETHHLATMARQQMRQAA